MLCRVLTSLKCRPLCGIFAGILKGQPGDKARGIGDEPENVGSPVRGNDQVGFKTRLNRLHDQQRRFIQALKRGLPQVREALAVKSSVLDEIKPLSKAVLNRLYRTLPDDDGLEDIDRMMASQSKTADE